MPSYKLVYFDAPGRAELPRLIMNYGDIAFEDYRLKSGEWNEMKPKVLFGHLPYLEVDGRVMSESGAITRFLAKEAGLAGKDSFEHGLVDMILCKLNEITLILITIRFASEDTKAEVKRKFEEEQLPTIMGHLEKYLEKGSGFFVGDKISAADLGLYNLMGAMEAFVGVTFDLGKSPKLAALMKTLETDPKIVKYVQSRK